MSRNNDGSKQKCKKMRGTFEDSGRWLRCWNCGVPLDTHNNSLVGGIGNTFVDTPIASEISDNDPRNRYITIDVVTMLGVSMKLGADGEAIPVTSVRKSSPNGGCWNCGTNNLP